MWPKISKAGATIALWLAIPTAATEQISLASFVRETVASNAAVLASEATLRAYTARKAAAAQSYDNPELSIETEQIGASDTGDEAARRYVVGLAKQFDIHGKRIARVSVAELQRLVAEAELDNVRATTAGELLNALAIWWTTSHRIQILDSYQSALMDFQSLAEQRRAAGDISRIEANLATLALAETRILRATVEADKLVAEEGVRRVTFADDVLDWPSLDFEFPPMIASPTDSVSTLPVVRVAMMKAQALAAVINEETSNRRPDPTLSLSIGREAGSGVAEISVSVPVPVRNRGNHAISAATADAMAAMREKDNIVRRARVRFETNAERYRLARRAWQEWQDVGVVSLVEREKLARRSWEVGELDAASYMTHVEAAMKLRMRTLDLRLFVWKAWFEWLLAAGGMDDWLDSLENQ